MKYSKKEEGGLLTHGQRPWVFPAVLYKLQNTPIAHANKAVPLLCDTACVVLGLKDGSNLPRTTIIRDTKLDHDYVSIVIAPGFTSCVYPEGFPF